MELCNFGIYYLLRELKFRRRRRHALKRKRSKEMSVDIEFVESNADDGSDGITIANCEEDDFPTHRKPFICRLILIWGYLEILLLLYVLIMKEEIDYPDNFLYGLCLRRASICKPLINRIILYKILTAVFLVFGAITKSFVLMMPWLFVNVMGIFPLWLVTISAFRHFVVERENVDVLANILRTIFH